jgi:hypothetical protein
VIVTLVNGDDSDNEAVVASAENFVWEVCQITKDRGNKLGVDLDLRVQQMKSRE